MDDRLRAARIALGEGVSMLPETYRGHAVIVFGKGEDSEWYYADRLTRVAADRDRDCGRCSLPNTPDGHDGCIANLPGNVMNACCGHGDDAIAYVQFRDGRWIGGSDALAFMRQQGRGPC